MPELYEGQTEVVAGKLAEAELILQANRERLQAVTDPEKRARLLELIAGQSGTVGAYRRQLSKCQSDQDTDRTERFGLRLSAAERTALETQAGQAGQTLAQYIRARCGLS
jgi:hypothetical protein